MTITRTNVVSTTTKRELLEAQNFLHREGYDKFEDGFIDAVDKIKELMETGEFRGPIAERQAQNKQEIRCDDDANEDCACG